MQKNLISDKPQTKKQIFGKKNYFRNDHILGMYKKSSEKKLQKFPPLKSPEIDFNTFFYKFELLSRVSQFFENKLSNNILLVYFERKKYQVDKTHEKKLKKFKIDYFGV